MALGSEFDEAQSLARARHSLRCSGRVCFKPFMQFYSVQFLFLLCTGSGVVVSYPFRLMTSSNEGSYCL